MRVLSGRPSPALVISLIALFVSLGGTASALIVSSASIADNSVASVDLRNNDVSSVDVHDGSLGSADIADASLLASDFAPGQLPAGAQGARGRQGRLPPERLPHRRQHRLERRRLQQRAAVAGRRGARLLREGC